MFLRLYFLLDHIRDISELLNNTGTQYNLQTTNASDYYLQTETSRELRRCTRNGDGAARRCALETGTRPAAERRFIYTYRHYCRTLRIAIVLVR